MENADKILGIITIVLLLVMIGPTALRFNMARGTTTRNILIWLLIFIALVWVARFFGRV